MECKTKKKLKDYGHFLQLSVQSIFSNNDSSYIELYSSSNRIVRLSFVYLFDDIVDSY